MHGRGEIIRPVSGKGKGGLPRTASAGRIGAGNTLPRLRSGERKEGRREGEKKRRREKTEKRKGEKRRLSRCINANISHRFA